MTPSLPKLARILIVEDDARLAELVGRYLEDHGYEIVRAGDGEEGERRFHELAPELVILDLMLPGKDGLTLCRELRRAGGAGILILTARGDETDRVVGLELGADDYLTKPFGLPELLARVRAILRRCGRAPGSGASREAEPQERERGRCRIDLARRSVTRDGEPVHLTRSEFDLLELLTRVPGRVYRRHELLERVRGGETEAYDRAVDTHVSNLRRKLGDDPRRPELVVTVWGVGYRWGGP